MNKNSQLFIEELEKIALKQNKSVDEVIGDYKHMLKELEYSQKRLDEIIEQNSYIRFPNNFLLHGYGRHNELNSKYSCYSNLDKFNILQKSELAIVTGFGPTNSPTAGTLCSIFRVLELQKITGIYTHIIISELSALNSRQKPLPDLIKISHQFISFIKKLGFDESNGEIRTHNNHDHSRVFSLVASVLSTNDLLDNLEITNQTYSRLQLLGNDFSKMVSRTYTMTDIILPIVRDKKQGVIVPLGLEEHHHPNLAKLALNRMKVKFKGLDLIKDNAEIGALHGKLISGFFPYVKMSKSIPDSSINLGDSKEELYAKIIQCGRKNEEVVLQMMIFASNWDYENINKAREAFITMSENYKQWEAIKYEYLDFFIKIKKLWEESKYYETLDTYSELFSDK
jgi:tryptophanyl-tRNA synthetase